MKHWKWFIRLVAIAAIVLISCTQMSRIALAASKPAESKTIAANEKVLKDLPFENTEDFELATKGFIDKLPDPVLIPHNSIPNFNAWDLEQYQFLLEKEGVRARVPICDQQSCDLTKLPEAPPTVNPSLWRISQLNMQHGLYKVVPGIYQIRGYDLTVMTLVEGDTGWILIDPLTSNETAKAALDLANANIANPQMELVKHPGRTEPLPISAIIYTHSHVDHYAGVKGIIDSALVKSQTNPNGIKIYAPEGFLENVISENVFAGNVMSRRASYMFGQLIPKNKTGQVDGGLGKTGPNGTISLIAPTELINFDNQNKLPPVDGVRIEFQNAPNTEAPSEMMFYFPDFKALCTAENATRTLHNILTPRGARVRDALVWAKYLNQTIELFGKDVEVVFASHHWPTWDKPETPENEVVEYLKKHRDLYKYIHDQTLRLANQGYTMLEIAEMLELPPSLSLEWYNREYYGTVNYNIKGVYQRYLGWFSGNPAHLYSLPPEEAGAKYVEYMGGARAVIEKAKNDFANGEVKDYRWVAQVMSDVVFGTCKDNLPPYDLSTGDIDTKNCFDATQLEANALEKLGYQTESAVWRNFFLTGALELRNGVDDSLPSPESASPDTIAQMTSGLLFDYMAIRLNGWDARDRKYIFKIILPDISEEYLLFVENGVLNYTANVSAYEVEPNTTIRINRTKLNKIFLKGKIDPEDIIDYQGNLQDFKDFQGLLDKFKFWFNIVLP